MEEKSYKEKPIKDILQEIYKNLQHIKAVILERQAAGIFK